jgi:serine/threonine-protein kinase HipA
MPGGTRFTYTEGWQTQIACCFPTIRRAHDWDNGLHPFFQHLGAEGWLRERQARISHLAEEDDFGLLLRYGADCIGAVGVLPPGGALQTAPFIEGTPTPGRTVSGIQPKLLVVRDEAAATYRPATIDGPAPYIAKFNSLTLPTLVGNENLSLRWISAVLGDDEVTKFQRGFVAGHDGDALIVTRFDRSVDGGKLRMEDFAQILCKPRGADFAGKYDASYEQIGEAIRHYSVRPERDLARFFTRLVAFVLVSNGDAHLKNFSLLERPEGMRLSPVYDVVNVGVYAADGYSQRLALAIGNDFLSLDAITKPTLIAFATRIGLSKAVIEGVFHALRTGARRANKILPDPFDDRTGWFGPRYTETVRGTCLRLLEA